MDVHGYVHMVTCTWFHARGYIHVGTCTWLHAMPYMHVATDMGLHGRGYRHVLTCTCLHACHMGHGGDMDMLTCMHACGFTDQVSRKPHVIVQAGGRSSSLTCASCMRHIAADSALT